LSQDIPIPFCSSRWREVEEAALESARPPLRRYPSMRVDDLQPHSFWKAANAMSAIYEVLR
jgi:hypothetical protein